MHHVLFLCLQNIMLTATESLEYDVIYPTPHESHVDAHCFQVLAEGRKRPLESEVVMLRTLILDEIIVFLIDAIVS